MLETVSPRRAARWARGFVPIGLAVLVLVQTSWFRASTSETFDEITYLRMGFCIARDGEFLSLASPMTPPLPILLEFAGPALMSETLPDQDGWEWAAPKLIRQARRLTSILVGVPLVWAVYWWLGSRRGWRVGAIGSAMVALSPSVVTASSVATTDACFVLFAILALAALARYRDHPSRRSFVGLGVGLGLALASKQTGVVLFAAVLVEMVLASTGRRPGSTRVDHALRFSGRLMGRMVGLVTIAFLVDWGLYGFGLAPRFGGEGGHIRMPTELTMFAEFLPDPEAFLARAREWAPPLAIDTFVGQLDHAAVGHPAFLMGRHSLQGWWYFFPVAIAVKSTPAELAMMVGVLLLACRRSTWVEPATRTWLVSIAALLGAGMASSLNIGHRYMLLIYPLVALAFFAEWGRRGVGRSRPLIVAGLLLLGWQGWTAWSIAPRYLSYFNSTIGGPLEGYRYLVDSSLDWGQDLPSLRKELDARGYRRVALNCFGTASPSAIGLRWANWDTFDPSCDWLAISATSLQGAYSGSGLQFAEFRDLPAIRVAHSIFLYDLADPRVRAARDRARARSSGQPIGDGVPTTY